ncbi:NAD(P)-dependent dehydrogenase (short-subunit alcohol dehydrogenase family) [Catenuloplanes nepalensis]|uniref:NAD(P)-dependent dehydrogenase (Short-subunit alcohol dehydrogenase family) n=1 Tax=Catenuloplanes nepalensis TaxID=587533 RepID=A0ABT9MU00_9ACTN|nr:SDR family NAD(P)-dependent oxidoreductase [Catenuloplanes nepalensis]MDP9794733.1 NAD(P)-dependent dehydrogenase (short-subunit alcohol dehydrogenase family) [Catenuloplanes nepalensis]
MHKTIVITGASDGIGAAAARQLHRDGHRVVIVGRSPEKTGAVAREIGADSFVADFTRLGEVRALAEALLLSYPRIDVLANNAGGVFGDRTVTEDGFERTFQVNHLAPFLLTTLLLDRLAESRAAVVQTSSDGGRLLGRIDLDDLQSERSYSPVRAYANAKLQNVYFTAELHRRGLAAVAFHPGTVATSFAGDSRGFVRRLYASRLGRAVMTTPERSAAQLVWLATTRDWVSGGYYEKRRPVRLAVDPVRARELWERSERMVA